MSNETPRNEPQFRYSDLLPTGADDTPYRLVTTEGVSTFEADGRTFLKVAPEAIQRLTAEAMHDIAHYLRPAHLAQLRRIIDDPEASGNDRFVALDLLKNVNISAGGVLPMCQDTGTAIVMGKKSEGVLTGADDGEAISRGVYDAYTKLNLRYSPARAADDVRGEEHRHEPAGADRDLLDAAVARASRSTSSSSWPRAAARRTSRSCSRRPRRSSTRSGCWSSSTRRSARSARPPARRTTSPWSSAARRRSSR